MSYLRGSNCDCAECGANPCDRPFCCLELDTAGGDAGYDETFNVSGQFVTDRDIYVSFEAFTIKDRLIIYANTYEVYNSGCISGSVTPTVTIPNGTTTIQVVVDADCEGLTGTAWLLLITCEPL